MSGKGNKSFGRRGFLGAAALGAGSLALGPARKAAATRSRASGARPNIVLIMADDMGFSDIGCFGSEIDTPNIDRMAAKGMKFTRFHNAARCCPTRASLLTGLYPHQAGVGHMSSDHGDPHYQGYLNRQCVTIAEALRPAGYRTYASGKWHVGDDPGQRPLDRGFDKYFGTLAGGSDYFNPRGRSKLTRGNDIVPAWDDFYTTDEYTEHAMSCIEETAPGEPFFSYLAYNAPHWPLHAKTEDIEKYEDRYLSGWDRVREERYERQLELGVIDSSWGLSPRDRGTPPWKALPRRKRRKMARKMAVYAAMVDCMDQNVGRLLGLLERTGRLGNTLVMFLSDNGGCHENGPFGWNYNPAYANFGDTLRAEVGEPGSFASYGRGWANASNTPFRLHKHWTHEGGTSTPLLAHWPGVIEAGAKSNELGHVIDIMATCVDAAGAEYPSSRDGIDIIPREGKSLLPVFAGGSREGHGHICWEHEGNRAVWRGEWKLVSDYPGGWSLHNMEDDRTELRDLARKEPGKVRELESVYSAWAERIGVLPWNPINTLKY